MYAVKTLPHGPDPMLSSPFFSIVIPAYKTGLLIADALDSVLAQTFTDYEVIVVNDGSPDSEMLERELQRFLDRITYIKQENRGPAAARNAGIMKARGEYIAFLDSDDKWFPWHLEQMASHLSKDPMMDLMYADAVYFGELESAGRTCMEANPTECEVTFESLIDERCSVILSTVVARRQCIIDVGLFDENFKFAEDFDLWLRLAYRKGRFDYLRNVHAQRRIHDGNLTADLAKSFAGQAQVLEKLMSELPLSLSLKRTIRREISRCHASIALENGKQKLVARQYEKAREEVKRANTFFRRTKLHLILLLLRTAPSVLRYLYMKKR